MYEDRAHILYSRNVLELVVAVVTFHVMNIFSFGPLKKKKKNILPLHLEFTKVYKNNESVQKTLN